VPASLLRSAKEVTHRTTQLVAVALVVATCIELAHDNKSALPASYRMDRRPKPVRELMDRMGLFQGWYMFAPDAPTEDGTVVIDATLSNGQHVDPRTQLPPDFDAPFHGPWFHDAQWAAWEVTLSRGNHALHPYYGRYVGDLDKRPTWRLPATIRSLDAYWVSNSSPPPGKTVPFNVQHRSLLAAVIDTAPLDTVRPDANESAGPHTE